jgi:3-oxoacyl-[acyl-carrier protein] reductase
MGMRGVRLGMAVIVADLRVPGRSRAPRRPVVPLRESGGAAYAAPVPTPVEPLRPASFGLDGKVVVVTGAAQGIGEAIAFAARRAGARVAVCDRNADALADLVVRLRAEPGPPAPHAAGPTPLVEPHIDLTEPKVIPDGADRRDAGDGDAVSSGVLDVRDPEAVVAFLQRTSGQHGHIDVLVNNAGGGFRAAFAATNDKGREALVQENFMSVASCTRAALPHFPPVDPDGSRGRRGGGSIINITSIEAHRAGPGFAVYSAMKAAVANLSKSLALELGDRHIRVNCIAPDMIPTPGIISTIGGEMPVATPLPYAGHVDDVAAAFLYLASDVSSFVTGTTIHVDGGNHAAGGWHRGGDGSFSTTP